MNEFFNDTYALGKLNDLVYEIFTGVSPARIKLTENLHFIAKIDPNDFAREKHQEKWKQLQAQLLGKTRNYGTDIFPKDRLTPRNKTLESSLKIILSIYEDCCRPL